MITPNRSNVEFSDDKKGKYQGIRVFNFAFQTILLYILRYQFITIYVTHQIPYNEVPLNVMLYLRRLY